MNFSRSSSTHPEVQWFLIFYRRLVLVHACPFVKKAKHPSLSILYPLMKTTNIGKGSNSPRMRRNNVFVTFFHEFGIYGFFSPNFYYFLLKTQGRILLLRMNLYLLIFTEKTLCSYFFKKKHEVICAIFL